MAGSAVPSLIQHRSRGVVRTEIALTCDAAGVISEAVVGVGFGRIVGIHYDGGLDISAVITIKDKATGVTLIAYTTGTEGTPVSFRPTQVIVDNAGTTVAAAITATNVNRDIPVAGKISITVASGGVSETAKFVILVDEANLAPKPFR